MLAASNKGSTVCGGVEVGMLAHFSCASDGLPGGSYGPAIAKANHLERKLADYPRVVVGPTLRSYLDMTIRNADSDGLARANRAVALQCRQHLAQDTNGCWIVDYLNGTFANAGGKPEGWRGLQTDAVAFIQAELAQFTAAKDERLTAKYQRLSAYFERAR